MVNTMTRPNEETGLGSAQAGFQEAVDGAIEILERGGNAVDAGVAALLTLSVCGIGTTCIGGEAPVIVYSSESSEARVLTGQGAAPRSQAAIDWYLENGIPRGDIRASAVPAMIDVCVQALIGFGTLTFAEVSRPALLSLQGGRDDWYRDTESNRILCGLSGRPVTNKLECLSNGGRSWYGDLARTLRKLRDAERTASGNRESKLQAISDRFYRGDIAEDLVNWYIGSGGFLRRADLEQHVTHIEAPISVEYRGYTVLKCGAWTQGPYLAQALRLLEGWDLTRFEFLGADYIHLVTEALKLAIADRNEHFGDPKFVDVPVQELLCDKYTEARRSLIDMEVASWAERPGDPWNLRPLKAPSVSSVTSTTGTTSCAVADRWGNVFVSTPSGVGSTAGSGGGTGVTHGTRLTQFNTSPGLPNCIGPGKRPRTTLSPSLVLKNGKPVLALSIPSGNLQDQAAIQIMLALIDFSRNPDEIVSVPRFYTRHYSDRSKNSQEALGALKLSESIDDNTRKELARRGHAVATLSHDVGGISLLVLDQELGQSRVAGDAPGGYPENS